MNGFESDIVLETITEVEVKKPNLYKVVFHNDDYTPFEFVIFLLVNIFHKNNSEASSLVMQIHEYGKGIAGIYNHEIAKQKQEESLHLSREEQYPLHITLEEMET